MGKYEIKEDGHNGSVEVANGWVIRTYDSRFGNDHVIHIPLGIIQKVDHDRQIGGDVVTVKARDAVFKWKLGDTDAKMLAAEITSHAKL